MTKLLERSKQQSSLATSPTHAAQLPQQVTEWTSKLSSLFLTLKSTDNASQTQHKLLELLTPRVAIDELVTRHASRKRKSCCSSSREKASAASHRRLKTKSLSNISASSSSSNSNSSSSSNSKSAGCIFELYNTHRDLITLIERYKCMRLKELEHIRTLRRLNSERLTAFLAVDSNNNNINNETTASDLTTSPFLCCSCLGELDDGGGGEPPSVETNLRRCALCLDISHRTCPEQNEATEQTKPTDYLSLCDTCKRTRRPPLNQAVDMLADYAKLEVVRRSLEGNALQMLIHRAIGWRTRYASLLDADMRQAFVSSSGDVVGSTESSSSSSSSSSLSVYNKMSCLRKAQLADLYIEGLLIEIHMDEMQPLGELFRQLNKRQLVDEVAQFVTRLQEIRRAENLAKSLAAKESSQNEEEEEEQEEVKTAAGSSKSNDHNNNDDECKNKEETKSERDADQVDDDEFCAADVCTRWSG